MIVHYDFNLHLLIISGIEHFLRCLLGNLGPLWRGVYSGTLPIFNWIVCLPGVELYKFFIYFEDECLIKCIIEKYVLPFCGFPFYFVDGFSFCAKSFSLM